MQALRAPLALGWVLAVFLIVMQLRPGPLLTRVANRIAPITLGIYVLHPFWIDALDRWVWPFKQGGASWLMTVPLVYGLSAASSWLIAVARPTPSTPM